MRWELLVASSREKERGRRAGEMCNLRLIKRFLKGHAKDSNWGFRLLPRENI